MIRALTILVVALLVLGWNIPSVSAGHLPCVDTSPTHWNACAVLDVRQVQRP